MTTFQNDHLVLLLFKQATVPPPLSFNCFYINVCITSVLSNGEVKKIIKVHKS